MASLRSQWLFSLIEPCYMMKSAISHYLQSLVSITATSGFPLSRSQWQRVRDQGFASFWLQLSGTLNLLSWEMYLTTTTAAAAPAPPPSPTQEAAPPSISGALIPPLLSHASGVVLQIGPGSGSQLAFLPESQISKVYGAEPAVGLHDALRNAAVRHGIQTKYHILNADASRESLVSALVQGGFITQTEAETETPLFDTIICVRVLCSVPDPAHTAKELYRMLRPGGKMLVCEHVRNPWLTGRGSVLARLMQFVYMRCGWAFFVGNCRLDQDTGAVLRQAPDGDKGWAEVSLEMAASWSTFPYLHGVLVKE
ncbi:hypothetical protein ASPZODRAFT_89928 [Penicilliopsis zonata CBS 506.65]|uniref:Methyltransferase type 11 domain-containing protein n=1 Tax=Penicilliopsis zonata CBS 506.65 TaxID=1073090 RepID=A0A1L9SSK8_9EURO|nr:hypothetical protein ASPZODRAFT_89928 [Penicilliopsis zonata CBS 506.65]OJJ50094.1 hypothetical protein ASPZODRAFT_89928 [Penicilliopsis zonata CBS 506.65]